MAQGGIGFCEHEQMLCSSVRLQALTTRDKLVDFDRCGDGDVVAITFDDLAIGSTLPSDYLASRGIVLSTPPDCPPVIEATTGKNPSEHSLVTCAGALGDVTFTFASAPVLGLVFDRDAGPDVERPQYLLRVFNAHGPYANQLHYADGVLRGREDYALETTFTTEQAHVPLGFTSVFGEPIGKVELGIAGDCPASGEEIPRASVRIEEILVCARL